MTERPSILDGFSIEEILCPTPVKCPIGDKNINIYPMEDGKLMQVNEELERIINLIYTSESLLEAGFANIFEIAASVPRIVKIALPEVTKVIAVCLEITPAQAAQFRLADKVSVLRAIIEAEDVPLMIKNVNGLRHMFAGLPQPESVQEMGEQMAQEKLAQDLADLTAHTTTNS